MACPGSVARAEVSMRVPRVRIVQLVVLCLALSGAVGGQTPLASLSGDLLALLQLGNDAPVRAIVRGDVGVIQNVAARDGLQVLRLLDGMVVLVATPSELSALRTVSGVLSISRDARVGAFMTTSQKAIAADQARAAQSGLLGIGGYPAVTGKGVGVAVIDSGIATSHQALSGKVLASVNFATGETSADDGFGHGTHIAGIIAGSPTPATWVTSLYKGGIAPGAHLINVKVLGANGSGYTSDVIAGIQWTVANRAQYAIKVVNLSLGHPQVEPCVTDPLCLSVEKAAMAGLVVVVSAGNSGKDATGKEAFATITTPGVSPSAVTVGAFNTWNTDNPDDDTVTTYSSRGPTRFELGLKPDIVAPGNKIVSLSAPGSYLASKYPELHVAGSGNNRYMKMSGTSMAAAMVSGGAALLLEGGVLTARQVKIALQLSARFMTDEGVLRAGLGRTNLYSARRVNSAITGLTGVVPAVTIAGKTVAPTEMMTMNGQPLLDGVLAPVGAGVIGPLELLARWLDTSISPSRLAVSRASQLVWGDQVPAQQLVWGDQFSVGQQLVWGDRTPFGQQLVWGDGTLAQQLVWGDQTLAQQLVWGDQTSGQQLVWGDQTTAGQQLVWGDYNPTNANQLVWGDNTPDGQ